VSAKPGGFFTSHTFEALDVDPDTKRVDTGVVALADVGAARGGTLHQVGEHHHLVDTRGGDGRLPQTTIKGFPSFVSETLARISEDLDPISK
jgi:hypothetical protein